MFSIKYTSPKATARKGAPPTMMSDWSDPLHLPSLAPAGGVRNGKNGSRELMDNAANFDDGDGSPRDEFIHRGASNFSGIEQPKASDRADPSEIAESDDSENDSAVANISEAIEPRSNLIALLDREYTSGSSSGVGIKGEMPSGENVANCDDGDVSDHDLAMNETEEDESEMASDDRATEDSFAFRRKDSSGDTKDSSSARPSSVDLPEGHRLSETAEGSLEYRRSESMDPLVDAQPEESGPSPRMASLSVEDDSVEVTSIVGITDSLLRSWASDENNAGATPSNICHGKSADPSSPMIYFMSEQPASPLVSEINGDRGDAPVPMESPESNIGGDTYFEDAATHHAGEKKPRDANVEDDSMHVPLPPRVNRTSVNGRVTANAPFSLNLSSARTAPFPNLTPRRPFSHAHSLLDDCSDEEEEVTFFTIVDSPDRHVRSYSCLPRASIASDASSPFSSYIKKKKQGRKRLSSSHSAGSSATQVANNNLQWALLRTRHRRWDCQSAYAGVHAQSNEVFDVSNRVHYPPQSNDSGAPAARLSVSVEAIQAAALASGLWRSVRLIRLPRGLFRLHSSKSGQRGGDKEIRALLKMIDSTFPVLEQVDFGGDIFGATNSASADNDDWRTEVLSFILECLPKIVAIDGFLVELDVSESENLSEKDATRSDKTSRQHYASNMNSNPHAKQGETTNAVEEIDSSASCVDCEVPMCGLSDLVDTQTQNSVSDICIGDSTRWGRDLGYTLSNVAEPGQPESMVDVPPDAIQNALENDLSVEVQTGYGTIALVDSPSNESTDDEMKKVLALSSSSSSLSPSQSWGSTGSGTRPPTCPNSVSRRRPRLPTKPVDRKKGLYMKAGGGMKRRVLGLIPSVSMMDEDEDSEDSDESEAENDCPTDLL